MVKNTFTKVCVTVLLTVEPLEPDFELRHCQRFEIKHTLHPDIIGKMQDLSSVVVVQ